MNLSELICGRPSEWADHLDDVGEASKVWIYAPAVSEDCFSSEKSKEEIERNIYVNEISEYL
ncbi:hypothetical protein HN865_00590 [Candidatus Woesearchaeota archaeon]|jgi:hypothetical protein|nr:hypothetical protein [Candidatus Woesearchaeota archaeon]MBT7237337.1 hypothetical protein [Candidatus Woesearchaeota archaeon]